MATVTCYHQKFELETIGIASRDAREYTAAEPQAWCRLLAPLLIFSLLSKLHGGMLVFLRGNLFPLFLAPYLVLSRSRRVPMFVLEQRLQTLVYTRTIQPTDTQ